MLQLILFSPDSIVPSGAALSYARACSRSTMLEYDSALLSLNRSLICHLQVFYLYSMVYSYPNETQPLVTRVTRDRLSLSSPFHLPCISLASPLQRKVKTRGST